MVSCGARDLAFVPRFHPFSTFSLSIGSFDGGSKVPVPKMGYFSELKEGDVRMHSKYFEFKNYAVRFQTGQGANIVLGLCL
jgi:hypothetical protein